MSVIQRSELEDSPLADLHAIASELGIEGYRALRRDDLIAAILGAQGGDAEPEADTNAGADVDAEADEGVAEEEPGAIETEPTTGEDEESEPDAARSDESSDPHAEVIAGTLDILPNGSGFIRMEGGGQSSGDVYVSPAQIRRCELRAGDVVGGPLRPPRRNERHPSLVRVESVNGGEPEPPEQRPQFSDLTPVDPTERLAAPASLDAVPFGKGSRVAIAGVPGAGATRLLSQIARTLEERHDDVVVIVALVGARPEEVTAWRRELDTPVAGGSFDRSIEAQTQAVELSVERAKRLVERGRDAVVIVDSLQHLPPGPARRLFGAGRKVEEGGSLTVIGAVGDATEPLRQASTRITLDAATDEPTVLAAGSGAQRPDLLA